MKKLALRVGSNVSSIRPSLLVMAHEDSTDQPSEESWTKYKKQMFEGAERAMSAVRSFRSKIWNNREAIKEVST